MASNRERLERLGSAILSASRNELYFSMRFLDIALSGLDYRMNLNTVTVGTDGVSILFNPTYLQRIYRDDLVQLNRVYLHMILHCMFRHELNREGRDEDLWTVACDIAVESILDGIENRTIQLSVSTFREETYDWLGEECPVLTAEAIYRALERRQVQYLDILRLKQEFLRDDHQFWQSDDPGRDESQQQENSDSPDSRAQQERRREVEAKWKRIDEKTQTNLETFFAGHGDEMGGLLKSIQIENRERYDYRAFLRRFVTLREEVKTDPDSFDYAFYSYGLELYGNIPLIEPLEYRESRKIRDFVIVIDTSDSCSDGIIERFLSETRAILNQESAFFREMNLHIIQSDAGVQMDTVLHSPEEFDRFSRSFTVKGYGGTDFRPAFDYVANLQAQGHLAELKGLLYFTDGFGAYPQKKPPYDTAFVFFREEYTDAQVPPWAMKVVLGPEELQEL
ncbi:MAG: VWA-like domain-containing protein [Clostridiales bacterium]|nr:VWA-like domain-containing protein [Clostridiales bacterium]